MSSMPTLRDLNKLNTFVRVAERGSFTQAARDLHTTPSVVSKHMSELEDALGFSFLNRSPHGVTLTEAGSSRSLRTLRIRTKRMRAYYSKTKYLPAKTVAFIDLLPRQ